MSLLTTPGSGQSILSPPDVQNLVIQPLIQAAVATRVSTIVQTGSHQTRFPIVLTDAVNAWTQEGQPINVTDPELDELVVTPSKCAGLVVVSNELMNDSDPSALEVVGQGLVRDLALKIDAAFFGTTVSNGPDGLGSLLNVSETLGEFDGDLDLFAEAISAAELAGVGIGDLSFVAHPTDVLTLVQLKTLTDSNEPLLGNDAAAPTQRSILGVALYSSIAVAEGTAWAIPRSKTFVVIRQDAEVIADSSAYFGSDSTAVRCVIRVGYGFPHEESICKIAIDGGS